MPERLLEFNRLELARRLQNPDETKRLIKNVQELIKLKFKNKYVVSINANIFCYFFEFLE